MSDEALWLLLVAIIIGAILLVGFGVSRTAAERFTDDSILINCIQIGEETLNGETSTFYTCEGIR